MSTHRSISPLMNPGQRHNRSLTGVAKMGQSTQKQNSFHKSRQSTSPSEHYNTYTTNVSITQTPHNIKKIEQQSGVFNNCIKKYNNSAQLYQENLYLKSQLSTKNQQIQMMKQHIVQLETNINMKINGNQKDQLEALTIQLENLTRAYEQKNHEFEQLQFEVHSHRVQTEYQDCSAIDQLHYENQLLKSSNDKLKYQIEQYKLQITATPQFDHLTEQIQWLKNQENEYKTSISKLLNRFSVLEQDFNKAKANENYLNQQITNWKSKFSKINREYHKLQEQIVMLKTEIDTQNPQDLDRISDVSYRQQ